jgi:hypothetical protein
VEQIIEETVHSFYLTPERLAAGFATTFFPRVMPRLTNAYYSKIGARTRVAEEDYDRLPTRIAGAILLAVGLVVSYRILISLVTSKGRKLPPGFWETSTRAEEPTDPMLPQTRAFGEHRLRPQNGNTALLMLVHRTARHSLGYCSIQHRMHSFDQGSHSVLRYVFSRGDLNQVSWHSA